VNWINPRQKVREDKAREYGLEDKSRDNISATWHGGKVDAYFDVLQWIDECAIV
jgi:hypothetical protein